MSSKPGNDIVCLTTAQPMIDYAGRWLLDNLPDGFAPALVHNDFRNGNVMFSPRRRGCGAGLGSRPHW